MPHCIIEITKNLASKVKHVDLMKEVAHAINIEDIFVRDDIKVRIYEIENSFMGIDEQNHSYVSAEIVMLNNKSEDQFSVILESVQNVLVRYFDNKLCKNSITSRITFIDPKYYKRKVNY